MIAHAPLKNIRFPIHFVPVSSPAALRGMNAPAFVSSVGYSRLLRDSALGDWLRRLNKGRPAMRGFRTSFALAGAVALAITVGGCAKYSSGGGASADEVKAALKDDEKKWNDDFKSKDLEGLLGHYASDAYFVAPGVKSATGSTEIRKVYADATSDPAFEIGFASDRIDVAGSGDLAYARGHFTEKYTDPKTQKVMTNRGSYVTVYKKQADGSWKAVEDFAVADPDSTKPVEPGKAVTKAKMVSGM
jgi:uncharacterized protein (TIGR02246 family)